MKNCGLIFFFLLSIAAFSQNSLKIIVRNEDTKEPLAGASVLIASLNKGAATDSTGSVIFQNLPAGTFVIDVSYVGFSSSKEKISLPFNKILEIELEPSNEEDNPDIVVSTTRTDRSVRNTPTRVEVIAGGEISENVSMRPGEIKMLLNETTGLITQQTSAISNTANIRIQELEGRYTQVLRDGFPLYSGLSEGLSLVQIAPLDLKQVEIIKGSSSTLYGGGAIAGLINLVSKTPTDKREISFLANGTSTKGVDVSAFYSEKYGKAGVTLFTSANKGSAYDPSNIGLTAIPKFTRYTITPRLFIYDNKTNLNLGVSYITEDRLGGSLDYIEHGAPGYFEKNNSDRFTTQLSVTTKIDEHSFITLKNSYNHFNRTISIPGYQFSGLQQSSFSELSFNTTAQQMQWVTGLNFYSDDFKEKNPTPNYRNYHHNTLGTFVQNTWSPNHVVSVETGLRGDYTNDYGFALLPRVSALFFLSDNFSSRIGGGFGYKIPTIFAEESEELQFRGIIPINQQTSSYERSVGGNIDFTCKINLEDAHITFNPLFFYTRINHPSILVTSNGGRKEFINANGYTDSKGIDVSLRISIERIKFFTGYSYTLAKEHFNTGTFVYPLAPKHKLHFDLVYEVEGKLRVALESYYTSKQQLSDGTTGKQYWLLGALIEKSWKHFSIFINGEDLNDARQTKWDTIYTGSISNPTFRDIYTPLEGRTINAGIKVRL